MNIDKHSDYVRIASAARTQANEKYTRAEVEATLAKVGALPDPKWPKLSACIYRAGWAAKIRNPNGTGKIHVFNSIAEAISWAAPLYGGIKVAVAATEGVDFGMREIPLEASPGMQGVSRFGGEFWGSISAQVVVRENQRLS